MPPRLYSSGGEVATVPVSSSGGGSVDLDNLSQMLERFNSTFGQMAERYTAASLQKSAKVAQFNAVQAGERGLVEAPRLVSEKYRQAYEAASTEVLVRTLQNDIIDLGAQSEAASPTNPVALQEAMRSGYSQMRAAVAKDPNLAGVILPILDAHFDEELGRRNYATMERKLRFQAEEHSIKVNRLVDEDKARMQDEARYIGTNINTAAELNDKLGQSLEAHYARVESTARLDPWANPEQIYATHLKGLQDKAADNAVYAAYTGFIRKRKFGEVNKLVEMVQKGEFFRDNAKMKEWRERPPGRIKNDLKYFIKQLESQTGAGRSMSDILARVAELNPDNEFVNDLDLLNIPDESTAIEAIKTLYMTSAVLNKGDGQSELDQYQTLMFGAIVNKAMANGGPRAVAPILEALYNGEGMKLEPSVPDSSGFISMKIGDAVLFDKHPAPVMRPDGSYILTTPEQAAWDEARTNPNPVMQDKTIAGIKAQYDKSERKLAVSRRRTGNAVDAYAESNRLPAISIGPDLSDSLAERMNANISGMIRVYGDSPQLAAVNPIDKGTADAISSQLENMHIAGDYAGIVKTYRDIDNAGDKTYGVSNQSVYTRFDKKQAAIAPMVRHLNNADAAELLRIIPKDKFNAATSPLMGAVALPLINNQIERAFGAQLSALSNGDPELREAIVSQVMIPIIDMDSRSGAYGKDDKGGIDYGKAVDAILSSPGSAIHTAMKKFNVKEAAAINYLNESLGRTFDKEYDDPVTASAIRKAVDGVGSTIPVEMRKRAFPVVTLNSAGERVVRLATRPNGTAYYSVDGSTVGETYEVKIK